MQNVQSRHAKGGVLAFATTLVLFFLALDLGQSMGSFGLETIFSLVTLLMLIALPYFLPFGNEKPPFCSWLLGRISIAFVAIGTGILWGQSVGTVVPDSIRFAPMTLLIVAAMFSCYLQFYGMLRVRLAR